TRCSRPLCRLPFAPATREISATPEWLRQEPTTSSGCAPYHRLLALRATWCSADSSRCMGVWLLVGAARCTPDQRITVNQLNWHARGELPRRLGEDARSYENAFSRAHFLDGPGEPSNAPHTDLIDQPVLALDQA